jgi:hypothetical protein
MATPSQSPTLASSETPSLDTSRLYQDGFIAGTLGAATIAVWFLILDLIQGRPFFTPTVLGTVLFKGVGGLENLENLQASLHMVGGFTFVHWLVFVVLGCAASRLLGAAERNPNLGFGVLLLFVVFMLGLLAAATVFAEPILQALAWPAILIGNLLAAIVMGLYFWRRHPHMVINP